VPASGRGKACSICFDVSFGRGFDSLAVHILKGEIMGLDLLAVLYIIFQVFVVTGFVGALAFLGYALYKTFKK